MASPGPPWKGTVTPVDLPLGAGTDANQIPRVRPSGFAQFAGTVATPQRVVASNGAGHASVSRVTGYSSMRSALLGVAVRSLPGQDWAASPIPAPAASAVVTKQS